MSWWRNQATSFFLASTYIEFGSVLEVVVLVVPKMTKCQRTN